MIPSLTFLVVLLSLPLELFFSNSELLIKGKITANETMRQSPERVRIATLLIALAARLTFSLLLPLFVGQFGAIVFSSFGLCQSPRERGRGRETDGGINPDYDGI